MELTLDEQQRMDDIVTMKRRATGVLVVATAIFIAARVAEADGASVWGYIRATAEAAMVGGLADWFAVTALFRHPLGIPIPHTAILPNRKDQLGATFGSFVRNSFLAPEVLTERLTEAAIATRLSAWMTEPDNAATAARYAGSVAATVARLLDDDDVAELLSSEFTERLGNADLAPLVARAVEVATEDGRHHQLVDAALNGAADMMATQRVTLRDRFNEESPWWVPEVVDDKVFAKVYAGLQTFIDEVRSRPDHPLRLHVDQRLEVLVDELRTDPERARRIAEVRDDLLQHPAVADWSRRIWVQLRERIIESASEPDSNFQVRLADGVAAMGHALANDPELSARAERTTIEVASTLADRYGEEVADFVKSTVERWDATETSTRVELLLGRDLQIIRINGSVVGGLAGLTIHTVAELLT